MEVLRIKPRTSCILSTRSTTELFPPLPASCFSPMGRETQAFYCRARRPSWPWLLAWSSRVKRVSKMTPLPKSLFNYLVKPKLWRAGRTGFCQDKHKRVREMLVWLINATWGSNSGCVHTVPRSLPGCDKTFPQLLPLRTRSSKGDTSTLTCPRSGLASRAENTDLPLATTH